MSTFQAPAILNSISYTKDGGLRVGFVTNELPEDQKLIASHFHNKFGFVLFKENEFSQDDVPKQNASGKYISKSQQLRATLYVYWNKIGQPNDFDTYYDNYMNKLINGIKTELKKFEQTEKGT